MGAVFTIFLLTPISLPFIIAGKILEVFGIDSMVILDNLKNLLILWLSENPEIVDIIRNILMS